MLTTIETKIGSFPWTIFTVECLDDTNCPASKPYCTGNNKCGKFLIAWKPARMRQTIKWLMKFSVECKDDTQCANSTAGLYCKPGGHYCGMKSLRQHALVRFHLLCSFLQSNVKKIRALVLVQKMRSAGKMSASARRQNRLWYWEQHPPTIRTPAVRLQMKIVWCADFWCCDIF